ncbi:MAG: hypothetical protein FJZ96_15125 [Chloroflexi bacterium]|nr:hypothetical protein [Chloroflexota bacterium]
MAAMGGLTAYVLDEQRKRKQAESQQKAEVEQRAARFNAEQEQRRAEALEEQRKQAEAEAYWAAKTAQDSGESGNAPRMSTNLAEMDESRAMVYSQEDIGYYQRKQEQTQVITVAGTPNPTTVEGIKSALTPYGVFLTGDGWTLVSATAIYRGVIAVDSKLAITRDLGESPTESFRAVFGTDTTPLHFLWGNTSDEYYDDGIDIGQGGLTVGDTILKTDHSSVYLIKFVSIDDEAISARNNVVHELGHLFNRVMDDVPYNSMNAALSGNVALQRPDTTLPRGFASAGFPWQQSTRDIDRYWEIFADQFLGWVFDTWETDLDTNQSTPQASARVSWMNENMPIWVKD